MIDALGFGFAEIVPSLRVLHWQSKPRLFRLPAERAIVVNYGLPNDGAAVVAERLARYRPRHPLGVNIVKTNDGPDAPACSMTRSSLTMSLALRSYIRTPAT